MIDNFELAENLKEAVEDYCLEQCCVLEDYPFECHAKDAWSISLHKNCKARKWLKVLDEFYQQAASKCENENKG